MTAAVDVLYTKIGQRLVDLVSEPFVAAWVRVEMADDFGSVGVFVDHGRGAFVYLTDQGADLYALFRELRRRHIENGLGSWTQATFKLESRGAFEIDFGFEDVSNLAHSARRREDWVERVLGLGANVDWQPE